MTFIVQNARWLAGGFLLAFFSSFGQTFFISIWGDEIRTEFALSHGGFGAIYMVATLGSALTLPFLGRLIDETSIVRFAMAVMAMLAIATALMGAAGGLVMLVVAIYLLRLFGQGLMTHTALTAMGRWYAANRGRAVSIATIGHQAGEAALPIAFVWLAGFMTWRETWFFATGAVLLVAMPLIGVAMRRDRVPGGDGGRGDVVGRPVMVEEGRQWTREEVLSDPLFWAVVVGIMIPPFTGTSIFFHQDYLIELNGWDPATYYGAFSLMAATCVVFALVTGGLIDRFGATRLLPVFFVPLGLSCLVAGSFSASWAAVAFMILLGMSYGISSTLFGALWPEVYGTRHLGAVRSVVTAMMVFFTAAGPGLTGALIDLGVPFPTQLQVIGDVVLRGDVHHGADLAADALARRASGCDGAARSLTATMTRTDTPRLRFAPSPTGRIHIGNARTALMNWLLALKHGGTFVLRFDDTDLARSTNAFADGIAQDLHWLGVQPHETVRQSERADLHARRADELRRSGLLYPCYETPDELERRRRRLMARGRPPVYDRAALRLTEEERGALEAEGRVPHWRFLLPNFTRDPHRPQRTEISWNDLMAGRQVVDLASMSDPVLVRGDGTYLYTLPSVVDDIELAVTDVVRGADHITNTGAQIALFRALGAEPPRFAHHNLLADAEGGGLSKRLGSLSIAQLRESGLEPEAVAAMAVLTGTSHDVRAAPVDALAKTFDPASVSRSPARFDPDELAAVNRVFVHDLPYEDARQRLARSDADGGEAFWLAVRANCERIADAAGWLAVVEGRFDPPQLDEGDREFVAAAAAHLPPAPWGDTVWTDWTADLKRRTDRKGRALFMPLRIALTGVDHGPELADLLPLIGPERAAERLQAAQLGK